MVIFTHVAYAFVPVSTISNLVNPAFPVPIWVVPVCHLFFKSRNGVKLSSSRNTGDYYYGSAYYRLEQVVVVVVV